MVVTYHAPTRMAAIITATATPAIAPLLSIPAAAPPVTTIVVPEDVIVMELELSKLLRRDDKIDVKL